MAFRPGVRLALDWGRARVGVAACDRDGVLAYPVETVKNAGENAVFARVGELVAEHEPVEVVFGLPIDLRGRRAVAANELTAVAGRLSARIPIPVRLVDERMSTAQAAKLLADAGRGGRARRAVIDQAAAVAILEHAIDAERRTGEPPGELAGEQGE